MENIDEIRYREAQNRVKKIKGFYTHLIVYVVINTIIIVANYQELPAGESLRLQHFSLFFFWGIGLVAHGLTVFLPTFILGKDWEERKIKQLMEREKNNRWE
ncbi:2TM domain-containing protein [Flavobacterium sp. CYK-4]|uniref:2TM domain-containing protein n=1 Tax=Flavobacterium lotistagni TaxID=2709660 RepID=UPI00140AE9E7|nr:2TM domain-containing protein [Flavobacterium lotistagni]NHM07948.1 2TM domain-containing protein [Flavobacterium lotistagni]